MILFNVPLSDTATKIPSSSDQSTEVQLFATGTALVVQFTPLFVEYVTIFVPTARNIDLVGEYVKPLRVCVVPDVREVHVVAFEEVAIQPERPTITHTDT
jgi:hypothetical protein